MALLALTLDSLLVIAVELLENEFAANVRVRSR